MTDGKMGDTAPDMGDQVDPAASEKLPEGTVIAGRYTIKKHLAAGGMGRVYVAEQSPLGRRVALKVMHTDLCQDSESVKRFFREAVAVSQLTHPNTITVFDYGESEFGNFYIAMEFLEGEPLSDRVRREGSLDPDAAFNIVTQVARSLSEAHRKGIIHRDLKPENVFLGNVEKDLVKVLDFGIAKILQQEKDDGTKLTRMGFVCGTPEYMSPEQARGEELDGRSDIYALGVLLYEILSGQPPFLETTPLATVLKHQNEPVPPLPDTVPAPLRSFIIDRALAKEREDRPETADAFVEELERAAVESGFLVDTTGTLSAPDLPVDTGEAPAPPVATPETPHPGFGQPDGPQASPTEQAFPVQEKRTWVVPVLAGAAALVVVVFAGILLLGGSDGGDQSAEAATATSEAAATDESPTMSAPAGAITKTEGPSDEPEQKTLQISLRSELEGIDVYDEADTMIGTVPMAVDVAPGRTERELTFKKEGFAPETETFDLSSGEAVTYDVSLQPLSSHTITSQPEGASIFRGESGDELLGKTPVDLTFNPGETLTLRFELDGHDPLVREFTAEEGATLDVELEETKRSAKRDSRSDKKTSKRPKDDERDSARAKKDDEDKGDDDEGGSSYKPFPPH